MMVPLRVTAQLAGAIGSVPMLDAMLMASKALRDGLPPVDACPNRRPSIIDIPIKLSPCGRFHLCSGPIYSRVSSELRYTNRRFPIEQAVHLGDPKWGRVSLSTGPEKSYRIPTSIGFLSGNVVTWYCLGERDALIGLLKFCKFLGKKRSVGNGKVSAWSVLECLEWEGFPVVKQGKPLRPLPPSWPGLKEPSMAYVVLGSVGVCYWDHTAKELCAVPDDVNQTLPILR